MKFDWSEIQQELAIWRREERSLTVWWRDDDAVSHTTPLDHLIDIASKTGVFAHLAVIPKFADQSLVTICKENPLLVPLVHGWCHQNHAPEGQKKAEFGHGRVDLEGDLGRGIDAMKRLFETNFLPCFVPPWNRVLPELLPKLPHVGFTCVSTFTPRLHRMATPDLVQINTHIDPINWRAGGGLIAPEVLTSLILTRLQDRRTGRSDADEPLGLLTHHLVHDPAIWAFTSAFLSVLLDGGATPLNLLNLKDDLP